MPVPVVLSIGVSSGIYGGVAARPLPPAYRLRPRVFDALVAPVRRVGGSSAREVAPTTGNVHEPADR